MILPLLHILSISWINTRQANVDLLYFLHVLYGMIHKSIDPLVYVFLVYNDSHNIAMLSTFIAAYQS